MKAGENLMGFLPSIMRSQPTRRLWEEENSRKEDSCRNSLNTPSNTE
jgi:hypothetical protein